MSASRPQPRRSAAQVFVAHPPGGCETLRVCCVSGGMGMGAPNEALEQTGPGKPIVVRLECSDTGQVFFVRVQPDDLPATSPPGEDPVARHRLLLEEQLAAVAAQRAGEEAPKPIALPGQTTQQEQAERALYTRLTTGEDHPCNPDALRDGRLAFWRATHGQEYGPLESANQTAFTFWGALSREIARSGGSVARAVQLAIALLEKKRFDSLAAKPPSPDA